MTYTEETLGGWSERVDYENGTYAIIEYDSQGQIIRETEYYQDGTTWFLEISYDGNTVYCNYDNYASDLVEYDEVGRITKQTFTYNDGRIVWNNRVYDENGNCTILFYNSSGVMFYEQEEMESTAREAIYFSVLGWE